MSISPLKTEPTATEAKLIQTENRKIQLPFTFTVSALQRVRSFTLKATSHTCCVVIVAACFFFFITVLFKTRITKLESRIYSHCKCVPTFCSFLAQRILHIENHCTMRVLSPCYKLADALIHYALHF